MKKVKGTLVFNEDVDGKPKPICNAFLQLWDIDVIANDYLAVGETDGNGDFEIEYDPDKGSRWNDIPDLLLRFVDREYSYDKQGQPVAQWHIVKSFSGGDNITDDVYDFGLLRASFWEYSPNEGLNNIAFTPRADIIDGKPPQAQRPGRVFEQLEVGARYFAAHTKHELIAKFSNDRPTNKEIENDYPENVTRKLGLQARSDAFISDLVLNGFNPCLLKKGAEEGEFFVDFKYDGLQLDQHHFAPNTTANFILKDNQLLLQSIALQKRLGGSESAHALLRQPTLYTPNNPEWDRIKRLFRCNYFLFGEVETHMAETHLNIEQYIIPMRRNLLQNPIGRLLFPHFYGTVAVNLAANDILMAKNGLIQKCSALTSDSVAQAARLKFGTLNWKGWRPRKPLCDQHQFAKLGELYWEVLTKYVFDFMQANDRAIRDYWGEVQNMSNELVAHALPFVAGDQGIFYDMGEINSISKVHPRINGVEVAISPVTTSSHADAEGLANLQELCVYLLFNTTFKHSWFNDLQYSVGGEIEFATLGVTNDISNLNVDQTKVVPPSEALEHPFITYILNYTKYGYIIRNEDDDMNPDLIKALLVNKDKFAKLNYDIRSLRSCINT